MTGYITLQDIFDAVRYDTRTQACLGFAAAVIAVMMYTSGGSSLSEVHDRNPWDGAGRGMTTCQIKAQAVPQSDRDLFIQLCQARASR